MKRHSIFLVLTLCGLLFFAHAAYATTVVVNSTLENSTNSGFATTNGLGVQFKMNVNGYMLHNITLGTNSNSARVRLYWSNNTLIGTYSTVGTFGKLSVSPDIMVTQGLTYYAIAGSSGSAHAYTQNLSQAFPVVTATANITGRAFIASDGAGSPSVDTAALMDIQTLEFNDTPIVPPAGVTNLSVSVNNTRTGALISGFSWNYTTPNASDNNPKSGYCSTTSCSITNFAGLLNITVFNVSGSQFFNPYDSPKLNFVYDTVVNTSYTFQAFMTRIRMNMTNVVNGSLISGICGTAYNGSQRVSGCNLTGSLLTLYGVFGNENLSAIAAGNSTTINAPTRTVSGTVYNLTAEDESDLGQFSAEHYCLDNYGTHFGSYTKATAPPLWNMTYWNVLGGPAWGEVNDYNGKTWMASVTCTGLNGSYFPANWTITSYNATDTNLTNTTSQSILRINATQLYSLSNIASFNITNNLLVNTTTNGQLMIPANTGSNNVQIRVLGNYSFNTTCSATSLTITSCIISGVYDTIFKINATVAANGSAVNTFSVQMRNTTFGLFDGGLLNTGSTTNGTAYIPAIQNYYYIFSMNATGFSYANLTRQANLSQNNMSFSLLGTNGIFVFLYDEQTFNLITQNMSVTFTQGNTSIEVTTLSGTVNVNNLNAGVWIVTAESANASSTYSQRAYFVTVSDHSTNTVNAYLLQSTQGSSTFFTIKDSTSAAIITNASVELQVSNGGNWYTADQRYSDLFGTVTFLLVPNQQYRLVISADGYATKQGDFYATQTNYVVVLDSSQTSIYSTYADDFSYYTLPNLLSNNVTDFSLSVTSQTGKIEWMAVTVRLNLTTTTDNLTTSPGGGTVSIVKNLSGYNGQSVTATYYIKDINFADPLVLTRTWYIYGTPTAGNYTLDGFMTHYNDDANGMSIVSRGMIATIGAVIIGALLGFIFGGAAAVLGASLVFSIAGFYGWLHPTIVMIIVGGLFGALLLKGAGR